MEGKLAAAQEREKELEMRVEELQGYKGQLEEELLTRRDETSKQVSILSPEMSSENFDYVQVVSSN